MNLERSLALYFLPLSVLFFSCKEVPKATVSRNNKIETTKETQAPNGQRQQLASTSWDSLGHLYASKAIEVNTNGAMVSDWSEMTETYRRQSFRIDSVAVPIASAWGLTGYQPGQNIWPRKGKYNTIAHELY